MSSAGQARARTTRQKVAAQRAAASRARRRKRLLFASVGVSLAVVLAIVLVVIRPGQSAAPAAAAPGTAAQAAAVSREVASVPAGTFDSVGAGTATGLTATSGQPPLTSDGKPEVLYMGGEFCPYCAAERWALTAALSRFGTFTGLSLIHSSPTDVYPSTPTLSFYKSAYTSKYVAFTPVEWVGEQADATGPLGHVLLQNPTPEEAALFTKYGNQSIPFVDIGNQYLLPQAQYLPSALQGMSWSQVAAALRTPSSPVARDIDGAANIVTAAVCKMTNGQPGAVCSSPGVTAAAGSLQSQ
jgi:peptidoglycan hydrolase-like protein with peptidoglycan-binding domain